MNCHPLFDETLLNAIARQDLYSFIRTVFPIIAPNSTFMPNWHIEAIAYELTRVLNGEINRLVITVPPRSLKSLCASVALPAFALGHNPQLGIICVSYSDTLAREHTNNFRHLMHSERYRKLFPTRISPTKDTESKVETTRGGYRFSTSVGGTLTGIGGNIIIVDDAMNANEAYSERARENVKQWHSRVLLSRLNNKVHDSIIVVMQRLHCEDYAGFLIEESGWHHLNLPAIAEHEHAIATGPNRVHIRKPGDLLHPEREPLRALQELRRSMGSAVFSAQYQQQPEPEDGDLIRWSWFRFYDQFPVIEPNDRIILSWDTAMSAKELASYSAGIVMLARGETVHMLDVVREHLEYPDLKRKVIDIHRRYRHLVSRYALLIENKGSGMNLIQDLRREQIHAVRIEPQADKIIRMVGQLPRIESGSVLLPRSAPWLDEFRREVRQFPRGRHDDQVDALSQGLQYLVEWESRRCHVLVSPGIV